MRRRLRRWWCARRGHLEPVDVSGVRDGYFLRARISSRCHFIFGAEAGPRRQRRRAWRDRLAVR